MIVLLCCFGVSLDEFVLLLGWWGAEVFVYYEYFYLYVPCYLVWNGVCAWGVRVVGLWAECW